MAGGVPSPSVPAPRAPLLPGISPPAPPFISGVESPAPPMFLDDVRNHQPAERNRYADGIRMMEASGGYVPGIWRLFAFRPAMADHLGKFVQEVLRGPSEHSPGFRELIAAFTSAFNRCLF